MGEDKTARLWDLATAKELRTFIGHTGWVSAVAFSRDGNKVLTVGTDALRVWNVSTGMELWHVEGSTTPVKRALFTPNGKEVWTVSGKVVQQWSLFATRPSHTITFPEEVNCIVVSPDGRQILVAGGKTLWLFAVKPAPKELFRLDGHSLGVMAAAFSADGKQVYSVSQDRTVRTWNASTGKETTQFRWAARSAYLAAFSPDGRRLVLGGNLYIGHVYAAEVWDVVAGNKLSLCEGQSDGVRSLAVSPDGKQILLGKDDRTASLWDLASGKEVRRFEDKWPVTAVVFSPNGNQVLIVNSTLWDPASGKQLATFGPLFGGASDVPAAFSPDGKRIATLTSDGETVRLLDAGTARELGRCKAKGVLAVTFSGDGKQVLLASRENKEVLVCDAASGQEVRRIGSLRVPIGGEPGYELSRPGIVAFSPNGGQVLSVHQNYKAKLWDLSSSKMLQQFQGHTSAINAVAFAPDGKQLLTGSDDMTARLWDVASGKVVRVFKGHSGSVKCVTFAPDGNRVVTAGLDRTVRQWDATTGELRCILASFRGGSWVVMDSAGRFDTDDLEQINGLHWVFPDDPLRPLPPEIFMRDYYEPRLLSRILVGETFKQIRSLANLNRVQSAVEVAKVEPQPDQPDEVMVTVQVTDQSGTFLGGGKQETLHSGVFDLQLFRDGRLIGYQPAKEGPVPLDSETGKATLRFEHVQLPRITKAHEVEFSAYAFNADRVKSPTHRVKYPLPLSLHAASTALASLQGTAYLICVGINAFDSPRWDLRFAVPDARTLAHVLHHALSHSGQFKRVVAIPLISDGRGEGRKRTVTENAATKDNLRTALALLAGKEVSDQARKQLPGAAELCKVQPDDLVLLSFSTHGFNGADGQFYLLPADIGTGHNQGANDPVAQRAISTDELTLWLRDVDAGEMVMVVDACHSAASVQQEGFKPGPMGSRGLGQLAYNKRMRILAASQAADVAFEDPRIGHGLLTYALCRDGLQEGRADFQPADGRITLSEWLHYGVKRVPELAEEIASGNVRAISLTGRDLQLKQPKTRDMKREDGGRSIAQRPSLFDFTSGVDAVLLSRLDRRATPSKPTTK
jgi:WD40 repeat protein/uncharacterized caspase-like protein